MELTILTISLISLLVIFILVRSYINILDKRVNNEIKTLSLSVDLNLDSLNSILVTIIRDSINEFMVYNNLLDSVYLTSEREEELREYVINNFNKRLSSVMMERLKVFYREDALPDVIARRIYLEVSLFTAQNNSGVNKYIKTPKKK